MKIFFSARIRLISLGQWGGYSMVLEYLIYGSLHKMTYLPSWLPYNTEIETQYCTELFMPLIFKRLMEPELLSAAKEYPVVTITGPGQAGKTTLVKNAFPHKTYINLEAPDTRALAEEDPRGKSRHPKPFMPIF